MCSLRETIINKPILILHDDFILQKWQFIKLKEIFLVLRVVDLLKNIKLISPTILYSDGKCSENLELTLFPYYGSKIGSGIEPHLTSYYFEKTMKAYTLQNQNKNRRYVIWTEIDPLPICATVLDRTNIKNLHTAIDKAYDWGLANVTRNPFLVPKSIAVVDLDETLIDKNCEMTKGSVRILKKLKREFDLVVLWSHGSPLHVDENATKINEILGSNTFNVVLCNDYHPISPKNLLYLYTQFPNNYFKRAILIDDSVYNWTPEYDELYVPANLDLTFLSDYL